MVGKGSPEACEAPGPITSTVKKQRGMPPHPPSAWMVTPTLRAEVPAQRCVSMMIPNLVELIMKIKYHKSQETKVKYLFHNITGRKHNSTLSYLQGTSP